MYVRLTTVAVAVLLLSTGIGAQHSTTGTTTTSSTGTTATTTSTGTTTTTTGTTTTSTTGTTTTTPDTTAAASYTVMTPWGSIGFSRFDQFKVWVAGLVAPPLTLTVSSDLTIPTTQSGGTAVTFLPATANGGAPAVQVTCDHSSGEVFPVGSTVVTCVAVDTAGQQTRRSFTVTVTLSTSGGSTSSSGGAEHLYFEGLVARPEHWKSYSLRDSTQLDRYRNGSALNVTYSPATDTYYLKQDAAKVVVPDYVWSGATLATPLTATDTVMYAPGLKTGPQVSYKIDNELLLWQSNVKDAYGRTIAITVLRGAYGTQPAAHALNTQVRFGSNSIAGQIRLPMGTEEGRRYLVTWDAWYGPEVRWDRSGLTGWKTFQFAQGTGDGTIGLEVRNRFNYKDLNLAPDEVSEVDMRAYLALGPDVLNEPIRPKLASFKVKAATWTRYWVLIEQVAGDWDRMSLWVADETRDPVLIHDRVPFESASRTFAKFWLEFNTSLDVVKPNRGPLVSYVRNVVMLRDVADPRSLMLRVD